MPLFDNQPVHELLIIVYIRKTDMIVVVPENDLSAHAIRPIIGFQWGKVLDWITTAFQGQAFNRSSTPVSWATWSACLWCTSETTVSDVAIKLDCLGKLCDDVWGCYWHKPAGSSRGDEHCYSGQSTPFCLHLSHCELGWVDAWWEGRQNVKWQKVILVWLSYFYFNHLRDEYGSEAISYCSIRVFCQCALLTLCTVLTLLHCAFISAFDLHCSIFQTEGVHTHI